MEEKFEFETIVELNRWFRTNISRFTGYYFDQYKDSSNNRWVLSFSR